MILRDVELQLWAEENVFPYCTTLINPASIDLRLDEWIRTPMWYWQPFLWRIAYKLNLPKWSEEVYFRDYLLKPGGFVLCTSREITKIPNDVAAILFLKSSIGRRGIEHLHAGFGDPGFGDNQHGGAQWTWELLNVAPWPNLLRAGEPLMQLVLAKLNAIPDKLYKDVGHYNLQIGPTPESDELDTSSFLL